MTNMYGTGAKGKATKLHAQIVRARGFCQRCGRTDTLQCAHIISRSYSWTRTDETNAWCLCGTCHNETGVFPHLFMDLIDDTIGLDAYADLYAKARSGVRHKFDWDTEVERLKGVQALMEVA